MRPRVLAKATMAGSWSFAGVDHIRSLCPLRVRSGIEIMPWHVGFGSYAEAGTQLPACRITSRCRVSPLPMPRIITPGAQAETGTTP